MSAATLQTAGRLLRLGAHLSAGAVLGVGISALGLVHLPRPWLPGLVSWWQRGLCRCLAVEIEPLGTPPATGLLVCNHVSWLDIPVLGGIAPMRFVSKAEVRGWPLVGWLAALAGTLFLRRGAHQATQLAHAIGHQVRSGHLITLFPEGTTSDGSSVGRFHARLFAAAEGGSARIQPVAIRYGRGYEPDPIAPFVGDDTLIAHLWRVLNHPGLTVTVNFLQPIPTEALTRRQLADAARAAVGSAIEWQGGPASAAHATALQSRRDPETDSVAA